MKLKDKVVVVTGSTRGIGRAIAEECAKEGAKVTICSRHEASAQEVSEVLKRQGLSVSGLAADVSVWGDLEIAPNAKLLAFGGPGKHALMLMKAESVAEFIANATDKLTRFEQLLKTDSAESPEENRQNTTL